MNIIDSLGISNGMIDNGMIMGMV